MSEKAKSFVQASIFLAITLFLIYYHFQVKADYKEMLSGYERLKNGEGKKANVLYDERYGELTLKSRDGNVKQKGTIISYTFTVQDKTYEGRMGSMNKSAEEMVTDSLYYLPEDPTINSLSPGDDYQWHENHAPWNWRLYLGILTALGVIGSFMKDPKDKEKKE